MIHKELLMAEHPTYESFLVKYGIIKLGLRSK